MAMPRPIAVIGQSECPPDMARTAEEVGYLIARAGRALVCGGMGGVMEAAAKGAKRAGGLTIGILPGESAQEANPYIDVAIVTGMQDARNVIVVMSASSVIAVGGQFGTLSEIAFALKNKIPVVGIGTWELPGEHMPRGARLVVASGPEEAVRKALAAERK